MTTTAVVAEDHRGSARVKSAVSEAIRVESLAKRFRVPVRDEGLRSSMRSLIRREHRLVDAVDGVSFSIEPGEVVGFLGPNGAGKTTTKKMLRRAPAELRIGLGARLHPVRSSRVVPSVDHVGHGQQEPAPANSLRPRPDTVARLVSCASPPKLRGPRTFAINRRVVSRSAPGC